MPLDRDDGELMAWAIGRFILSKSPWLNDQQPEANSKLHRGNKFEFFELNFLNSIFWTGIADSEQSWKSLINTLLSAFYLIFCSIFDPVACAVIALEPSFICWRGSIGKGSIAHLIYRPLIAHQLPNNHPSIAHWLSATVASSLWQ